MMTAYWMVLLFLIFCGYALAFIRKGKVGMTMPDRRRELDVAASPDEAFNAILHIAKPFGIDDRDPKLRVIIIQKPVALFGGWGFFFPVFIAPGASTGSHITIGCKSKVFQMGPLVTRAHNKCVEAIEATLAVPRVAVITR